MIELRHLRYFTALAEERHFGRAAERVYIAQSPFSRQIRQLEEVIGCRLVERGSRMTGLTPAGQVEADRAVQILGDVDDLIEAARRAGAGELGTLRVGFVSEVTADLLPLSLKLYRERHPNVHLELDEARTGPQLDAVRSGELDLAFARSPANLDGINYRPLVTEALVLALPEVEDPASEPPTLAACSERAFILPDPVAAEGLRRDVFACCRAAGFEPEVAREDAGLPALLLHVAAQEGVALVPASIAHQYPVPGVRYVDLAEPSPRSEIGLVWGPGEPGPMVTNYLVIMDELTSSREGETDVWPERRVVDQPPQLAEDQAEQDD